MESGLKGKLEEILKAIDSEMKAVKRGGNTSSITLFSGNKSAVSSTGKFLYWFEMLVQRSLPDGSRGNLEYQNKVIEAEVVSIEGQYLWLHLAKDCGQRIPQALYQVDLSFLLDDLKSKYTSLIGQDALVVGPGANMLMKKSPDRGTYPFYVKKCDEYLSPEQINAVEKVFATDVSAIHGPPGTGKTRTLAGALVECFVNEEKILVCGHTNRAVDEALKAFKRAATKCVPGQFDGAYKAGRILRKGVSVFPEEEPIIKNPEDVTQDLKAHLQKQLDEARRRIRDIEHELTATQKLYHDITIFHRLVNEYNSKGSEIEKTSKEFDENHNSIKNLNERIEGLEAELRTLKEENAFKKIFSYGNRKGLTTLIFDLKQQRSSISTSQNNLAKKIATLGYEAQKIKTRMLDLGPRVQGLNTTDLKHKIDFFETELDRLRHFAEHLEESLLTAPEVVINNALVIFATLSRTHLDQDLNRATFDRVFIDEASMASLPALFYAGFKARKAICIFGDPQQLAPICISSKKEVQDWFSLDIYCYAGLKDPLQANVAQLKTQRRMPVELGEMVSHLFYQRMLKHDPSPHNDLGYVFSWMGDRRVAILNTSNEGALCNKQKIGKGYSRINVVHAVIALSIFKEAQENGVASKKMAYITPYRAQAEFFGALILKNRDIEKKNEVEFLPELRWGTVHRFQGGEAELVIYDTCESPRNPPTRLTGGSIGIEEEEAQIDDASRLHCVALSRAKSHLIILANMDWLRKTLPRNANLAAVIESMSKAGSVLSIPEKHSSLRYFAQNFQEDFFRPDFKDVPYILCNENGFYKLLVTDLGICKKEVIFVSPFLSPKRISFLEPAFRRLSVNHVDTIIWTKDPSDLPTMSGIHKECVEMLEQLGATVKFRVGMHEKSVIIDRSVAYYGSLNPLSHRDTKETMFRIHDDAFAHALLDHLDLEGKRDRSTNRESFGKDFIEGVLKRVGIKNPRNAIDEEKAKKVFKKLRWVIAQDKGLPVMAMLWNRTIDWLLKTLPKTKGDLYQCEEFRRNKTNISGYEDVILIIVRMINNIHL